MSNSLPVPGTKNCWLADVQIEVRRPERTGWLAL